MEILMLTAALGSTIAGLTRLVRRPVAYSAAAVLLVTFIVRVLTTLS